MIRNLKALGLAAFAVLALGAMFASGASAQTKGFFTAGHTENKQGKVEHTDATVLGEQYGEPSETNNVFLAGGGRVNCDNATFTGTLEDGGTSNQQGKKSTNLTIEPHYEECYAEGSSPATVDMGSCDYVFTQPETWGHDPSFTGKADLTCEHEPIIITVYLFGNSTEGTHSFPVCTIEVFPNESESEGHTTHELDGHIIYTPGTSEGKDDLTVNATIAGINYNDGCHEIEGGEDGEYFNTVTVKAFEDEGEEKQIDAWISE